MTDNAERREQRAGVDKPLAGRIKIMQELIAKYGTSGTVKVKGNELPVINIPMMSDERWQELAKAQAVENFKNRHGREPESTQQALADEKEWIKTLTVV